MVNRALQRRPIEHINFVRSVFTVHSRLAPNFTHVELRYVGSV